LLYASASRPDVVGKALDSDAHVVIVDLEDSVGRSAKDSARQVAAEMLADSLPKPVYVRINGLSTEWWQADVEALTETGIAGLIVPKVEAASAVDGLTGRLGGRELRIHCLLETALGVERAFEIASHPRVAGISLGEADLRAETGASEEGISWARSRVVIAAVAGGLPRPPQSVYVHVRDLDGLRISCERGRALGQLGRTAVHPSQLPVIVDVYRPTAVEAETARKVLHAFEDGEAAGAAAFMIEGRFADTAALRAARLTVELADAYGTSRSSLPQA